jgi:diguanylate cyclase (GGDEF)-like protein/PAS domain S-box-containing protein
MTNHPLLQDQIRKSTRPDGSLDQACLLDLISQAYAEQDRERRRSERSIKVMIDELDDANRELEKQFRERTDELKSVRLALDAALQNTAQGILVIDENDVIVAANARVAELLNLPPSLLQGGPRFEDVLRFQFERGEFKMTEDRLVEWIRSGGIRNSPPVYERPRPDGLILEVRTVMLANGGAVRTFTDVTEARTQFKALQQAEHLHRSLFENAAAGLYRAALDGACIAANRSLAGIFGYAAPADYIAASRAGAGWQPVAPERLEAFRSELFAQGSVVDFVHEAMDRNTGRRLWLTETAWLMRDDAGNPSYYEGSVTDITERKQAEERLAYMAMHDSLTGLPNRAFLMHWLASEKGTAALQSGLAIHCIDLDGFKDVNDNLGHGCGDQLLRLAAERMQRVLGAGDFAVRLGGDEFAVVQLNARQPARTGRLAGRLVKSLGNDFSLGSCTATVGASIGSAISDATCPSGEQLLKQADIALYRAKSLGGRGSRLYDAELDAEHARRRMIEHNLRVALQNGEFSLNYQPILSLRPGKPASYEALIRWNHPVEGPISPAEFIPVAEQSDVIGPIGEWVLRLACETLAAAAPDVSISVNLSPAQLRQRGFIGTVVNTLASTGLAPHRLTLEITETVLLSDNPTTRQQLMELRALGVRIALDDFGSGHSSLAYLKSYDFDKIKIDRSFIANRRRSKVNTAVVNAVISLGRDLGIEVVAEGIETEEQLRDLAALGCDAIQGYLIGMPRPASAWADLRPCSTLKQGEMRRIA